MDEDTGNEILGVAIRMLTEHGSLAFRVEDLVAETGTSIGSLYRRFGSRDGVVAAALLAAVEKVTTNDSALILKLVANAVSVEEVLEGLRVLTITTLDDERRAMRWLQIEAYAVARHRPAMRVELERIVRATADAHVEAFVELQRRGWMSLEVDPYSFWLSIAGNTLGLCRDDVLGSLLEPEAWSSHTLRMFTSGALGD